MRRTVRIDNLSGMASDFGCVFSVLKPLLARHADVLTVDQDTSTNYSLVSKKPSPFPQHKGKPLFFGAVRHGKGYVSYHLMPLYMDSELTGRISPNLKKRMQGKACFNFKSDPAPALLDELAALTAAGLKAFQAKHWA